MTVSVEDPNAGPFTPNSATTTFPFSFKAGASGEIVVEQGGVALSSALYTVTLGATEGGSVIFTNAPLTGSGDIYIRSNPDFTQEGDFTAEGNFSARTLNGLFDRTVIRDLYLKARVDKLFPASGFTDGAGMFIGLDADGNPAFLSGTGNDADLRTDLATSGGSALVLDGTRSVAAKLADFANVLDSGVAMDGATDDLAALQDALAAHAHLYFPAGTAKLIVPDATLVALDPIAGAIWQGQGKDLTTLSFRPDSAAFHVLIRNLHAGLIIRDMTIELVGVAGSTVVLINHSTSNLSLENVRLDGGVTDSSDGSTPASGALSHTAYGISLSGGPGTTQRSLYVGPGSELTRLTNGLLKENAATSLQYQLRFAGVDFHGNYNEDCAFNTPSGTIADIAITGCTFRDGKGYLITPAIAGQFYISAASATRLAIIGNVFSGKVRECIHLEEAVRDFTIIANIGYADGEAVHIVESSVGGMGVLKPSNGVVQGNSFRKAGTAKETNSFGAYLVFNVSADTPAAKLIVADNIFEGYEYGLFDASETGDGVTVRANVSIACRVGFGFFKPSPDKAGNSSRTCDIGIINIRGGIVEGHRFFDCTDNVDSDPAAEPLVLVNPRVTFSAFNNSSTTVTKTLFPAVAGSRLKGAMDCSLTCAESGTHYVNSRDALAWDGSALTQSADYYVHPGHLTIAYSVATGALKVAATSSSGKTALDLQLSFSGAITVPA